MSVPNVVVQVNYVLSGKYKTDGLKSEKYIKEQKFYSSNSGHNYIDYIVKGSKDSIDYVDYVDNKKKTVGIFNENGFLDHKDIKILRKNLRETKSPIWHGVISFKEKFGHEKVNTDEIAMLIMDKPFKRFLERAGFSLANIEWYAGLHKNTDNNHIHFSFFEKEPLLCSAKSRDKRKFHIGKIKKKWFEAFKVDIERSVIEKNSTLIMDRGKIIDDAYRDLQETKDTEIVYLLAKLMEVLPRSGRLSYSSENCKEYIPLVDEVVTMLIEKNQDLNYSWKMLLCDLDKKDEEIKEMLQRNKISEKDYSEYLVKEKIIKDMYRRIGNLVLKYIKETREPLIKYCKPTVVKYQVKKAKGSILLDYANTQAYLEYEIKKAIIEYKEMMEKIRKEIAEEMEEESEI